MNKHELTVNILTSMGYKPETDSDGDIVIRHQMKAIIFMMGDSEDNYISAMLYQFFDIEDDDVAKALACCNKLTRDIKMCKTFLDSSFKSISSTCEFYFSDEESLRMNIDHSLKLLSVIRSVFKKTMESMTA